MQILFSFVSLHGGDSGYKDMTGARCSCLARLYKRSGIGGVAPSSWKPQQPASEEPLGKTTLENLLGENLTQLSVDVLPR